mgnify:CR=1 FL=1
MTANLYSCVQPVAGPILPAGPEEKPASDEKEKEVEMVQARVGYEAPDFEARAFVGGTFKNVKLSDHRGKWVVLCFYPGDFTFV